MSTINIDKKNLYKSIADVLFPKTRQKILRLSFLNPEKKYYLREFSNLTNTSPGAIERELKKLTLVGILSIEHINTKKLYSVNRDNPIFEELKIIIIKTFGITDLIKETLQPYKEKIKLAIIFGSLVKGELVASSDVDLLIVSEMSYRNLVKITTPLENIFQRAINLNVYSINEFESKYTSDHHFIKSVFGSEVIYLIGGINDAGKLVS